MLRSLVGSEMCIRDREYPYVTNFWNGTSNILHGTGGFFRRVYTGNGQTYLLQMVVFTVVTYLLTKGGM